MKLLLILIALCFSLTLPLSTQAQQIKQITQLPGQKSNHVIKMGSNNMLHLVYDINPIRNSNSSNNFSIIYQQSLDNGQTFLRATSVSQNIQFSFDPDIAVDTNGTIYVVWSGVAQNGRGIFLAKSTNNSLSFSTPNKLLILIQHKYQKSPLIQIIIFTLLTLQVISLLV